MTTAYRITVRRQAETIVAGKRLGRHAVTDSRSLAYPFRPAARVPVQTVLWERHAPIFDQGDIGSCTGNAMCGALATGPVWDGLPPSHPVLGEALCVDMYKQETLIDPFPGAWPPDDTGSDGTSAAKVAQLRGLISGYTHAATVSDVVQALMHGPVIIGCDWYGSFDSPAADGTCVITPGAQVRGGHEIVARGYDAATRMVRLDNSWGPGWGDKGSFQFSTGTLQQLLAQDGDAIVPVPWSQPPPVPVPVPPAGSDVAAWWAQVSGWATARHVGANHRAAVASLELARKEGLIP